MPSARDREEVAREKAAEIQRLMVSAVQVEGREETDAALISIMQMLGSLSVMVGAAVDQLERIEATLRLAAIEARKR